MRLSWGRIARAGEVPAVVGSVCWLWQSVHETKLYVIKLQGGTYTHNTPRNIGENEAVRTRWLIATLVVEILASQGVA